MSKDLTDGEMEALMTPEQREMFRQRKAQTSAFIRALDAFPVPTGSNADEWHVYLSENKDALPMVAVQIAEAIEAASARMWNEFVGRCEALETQADQALEKPLADHMTGFCRGQSFAAKSIRRSVEHPKYQRH